MFEEILTTIITIATSSIVTALVCLWFFMRNPEKVEKWVSMLLRLAAYVSERAEKGYMATNIQATIAEKRKKLGMEGDVLAYGIKINWVDKDSADVDLKENKVIVMMRAYKSQAKNFASIVSLYVPQTLLPRSRRFVDKDLMKSIDYVISKTILEDNPIALQYYVDREIQEHSEKIKAFIEKVAFIHETGRLTRVIIPELLDLSSLYPVEPSPQVHNETAGFVEEVYRFERVDKPTKDATEAGIFSGKHIRMAEVPVGKEEKLSTSGIEAHLGFMKDQINKGITHLYIVSSRSNIGYAKLLVLRACKELALKEIFSEDYMGKFRGKKSKMFASLCSKI